MPKIEAATVAEHRAMKERQVIDAAVELLTGAGPGAVTPAAVAHRSGLARTSVYQYAGSAAELVAVAVEELFRRADAEVVAALESAGSDPWARLEAIVRAVLAGAEAGHSPNHTIEVEQLPAEQRARLGDLHGRLMAPLHEAIADSGAADPEPLTALTWGAVNGIEPLIQRGLPLDRAVTLTVDFVRAGVRAQVDG